MFISDLITKDEIERWKVGDTILISSPTGSGKSYFVKRILDSYFYNLGYKILLLSNRKLLKQQNLRELCENGGNIVSKNYQELEQSENLNKYFENFDILVFDEVHYILNDALFNRNTDIFLDILKSPPSKKICIFITATPQAILSIKNKFDFEYTLPTNYSYIENIYFYHRAETLDRILNNIPVEEKCICFSSNVLFAYETSLKYPNSSFLCSESKRDFYRKVSSSEKNNIVEKEYFESQFLFTTKVLDNGINIKDRSVKHIIIDMLDPISFIQCLGRKRILDKDDTINLYVKNYHGGQLSAHSKNLSKKIKLANEFLDFGKEKFIEKYKKIEIDTIIDGYSYINWAKYYSYKYFQNLYYNMVIDIDKIGYKKYICNCLDIDVSEIINSELFFGKTYLNDYLKLWTDINMFKAEQEKFKEGFFLKLFESRGLNYRNRGMVSINSMLEEERLPYKIISKQSRKKEDNNKTYWRLIKNEKEQEEGTPD